MGQQAHQETHPFHRHLVSKKNPIHSSCLVTKNKTNKQQKEKQALHHQPVNKQEKKKIPFIPSYLCEREEIYSTITWREKIFYPLHRKDTAVL